MYTFLTWLTQTLASSAVVIIAFLATRSTAFGERLFSYHLDQKIAALRHAHEEKIEGLRTQLAHLQDRGRRANELEFDALTKVWQSFVDAWLKTQQAIVEYMSFPNLNALSENDLTIFLQSAELSAAQQNQVLRAEDKNNIYSTILRLRQLNLSATAIYDGRQLLRTNGVFIPATIAYAFRDAFTKLSGAQVERYIEFQHGRSIGYKS